jgi:hypothetical protein
MKPFKAFIDHKHRESRKQLKLIEKVLESQGMQVKDFLKEDDPYIFILNPIKEAGFDGIRLYKIGETIAFRVQKREKTHPFGAAYELPVEEMFDDILTDVRNPEKAGKEVIKFVTEEVKRFFKKSAEAAEQIRGNINFDNDQQPWNNKIVMRTNELGIDFANMVYTKG